MIGEEELEQAGLDVHDMVVSAFGGGKKEICDRLYTQYGVLAKPSYAYEKLWAHLISIYGIDLLARICITEMQANLPDEVMSTLKRWFSKARSLSWEDYTYLDERYSHEDEQWHFRIRPYWFSLFKVDEGNLSVEWSPFARLFFRYVDTVTPVDRTEVEQCLAQYRREALGIEMPSAEGTKEPQQMERKEPEPSESVMEGGKGIVAESYGLQDLEAVYEELLKRQGYTTQRHPRIAAAGGEIDVMGVKGNEVILVECKNWEEQTGRIDVNAIRIFHTKVGEAKEDRALKGKKVIGRYVSTSGFTDDARTLALSYDIQLIEGLVLAKELLEWGIIGLTIEGTNFLVVAPHATKEAARYNRATKNVEID